VKIYTIDSPWWRFGCRDWTNAKKIYHCSNVTSSPGSATEYKKEIRGLTHRTHIRLSQHSWPGNVREIENVIGHAAMLTMGNMIDVQDLPPYLHAHTEDSENAAPFLSTDISTLEEQERSLLMRALEVSAGNQSQVARLLRIGRDALRYILKKHNLETAHPLSDSAKAG